jgi:hypothetical protein
MAGNEIVLSGAQWRSVKWWSCNEREDLTARAVLCVDSLRAAGFLARLNDRDHPQFSPGGNYTTLYVEVYGEKETHQRARHHLRGLWAALDSKGLPKDYRIGYSTGVAILQGVKPKPQQLPTPSTKRLKA